jgi:hypothetical protein
VAELSGESLFKRLLSSTAKGDLLLLFRKNPGLIDTYDGIARRIGRRGEAIRAEAMDLLQIGVLSTKKVGDSDVLFLNRQKDSEVQESVAKYLGGLKVK